MTDLLPVTLLPLAAIVCCVLIIWMLLSERVDD